MNVFKKAKCDKIFDLIVKHYLSIYICHLFSNKWLNGRLKWEKVARSIISCCPNHYYNHMSWSLFRFGKGLYKEEYRCPGKKLDWDSNTGNCKYYVFEKASLCLQTMVHFETHVYTVEPRSSLISSSVGRAV